MRASLSISYVEESALVLCSNICGQYNDGFIVLGMGMTDLLSNNKNAVKKTASLACLEITGRY